MNTNANKAWVAYMKRPYFGLCFIQGLLLLMKLLGYADGTSWATITSVTWAPIVLAIAGLLVIVTLVVCFALGYFVVVASVLWLSHRLQDIVHRHNVANPSPDCAKVKEPDYEALKQSAYEADEKLRRKP